MRRTLITGGLLAVFAALLAQFGDALGMDEIRADLLGASVGAVLGLVPSADSPVSRVTGFLVGFLVGWAGYALRAGVLPDTGSGRAVAAFIVIVVLTGVCAATLGWMPLWSGLLGIAAIAGAYEFAFGLDPTAFTSESVTAATTVLLASAVGYLVGAVGAAFGGEEAAEPAHRGDRRSRQAASSRSEDAGMEIINERPSEA